MSSFSAILSVSVRRISLLKVIGEKSAVVLYQTQPADKLLPLMRQAERLMTCFCSSIPDLIDNPSEYISTNPDTHQRPIPKNFPWPTGAYHLLSLLQDGAANRPDSLTDATHISAAKLVVSASEKRDKRGPEISARGSRDLSRAYSRASPKTSVYE